MKRKMLLVLLVALTLIFTACIDHDGDYTQTQVGDGDILQTTQPTEPSDTEPPVTTQPEDEYPWLRFALNEDEESYRITGVEADCPQHLDIPGRYQGKPVTVIENVQHATFSSVTIAESIEKIEGYAFAGCDSLVQVTVPGSVKIIERFAFTECKALSSIKICDGVEVIEYGIVHGCRALIEADLPDGGYVLVHSGAFEGSGLYKEENWDQGVLYVDNYLLEVDHNTLTKDSYLEPVIHYEIKEGTVNLAEMAFYGEGGYIYRITLPDSLVFIGPESLRIYIETLHIPASVRYIGQCACDSYYLERLTFEEGVEYIGDHAFSCQSLTSVLFPASVKYFGESVLYGDYTKYIQVADGNSVYHSSGNCIIETATGVLIQGCNNSTIPNDGSVTAIGPSAFANCHGIKKMVIPEGVMQIGRSAFDYCPQMTQLVLPKSLVSIDESAFSGCSKLTTVTIPAAVSYIGKYAFGSCKRIETVVFENDVGWSADGEVVDVTDPAAAAAALCEDLWQAVWTRTDN